MAAVPSDTNVPMQRLVHRGRHNHTDRRVPFGHVT